MEKKFEVTGDVSIVSVGKKEVFKEDFEKVVDSVGTSEPSEGESLADIYDRYAKLLYVVDASISMGEGMLSEDSVKRYKWTPEVLAAFREAMQTDYKEQLADWKEEMADLKDYSGDDDIDLPEKPENPKDMSDDALKSAVVMGGLMDEHGISVELDHNYRVRSRSKMMALKDAAKKFVVERFRKFADARVCVYKFTTDQTLLCALGASQDEVMVAINRLPDGGEGGTSIYPAVSKAVNDCRRTKNDLGRHHIVFISDGEDYSAMNVPDLLPKMKEIGIVFDFIYMIGSSGTGNSEQTAKVLKEVCEATGGEYVEVRTEQDFEQKFLAASNRPMLPAPRS